MKKIALMIIGIVFTVLTRSNGQTATTASATGKTQYWSLGPVLGFGHNWLTDMSNRNFMPSGELGLGLVYSRHKHWGYGGDVTLSSEGYSAEYTMGAVNYSTTVTPVYIRINPKAYYFFGDYGNIVRPKVYLGPSLGFKITESYTLETTGYINGDAPRLADPRGEIFNTVDFGVKAGAGANIQLAKSTWLNTDIGYYQGLVDATGMDNWNSHLRLNLGVMFGL